MAERQRVRTPFSDYKIEVDPPWTAPKAIASAFGRAFSLIFGKRGNLLQPIWANKGGSIAVQNVNLSEFVYLGTGAIGAATWTDIGQIADLVICSVGSSSAGQCVMQGSRDGITTHWMVPPVIAGGGATDIVTEIVVVFWMWGPLRYIKPLNTSLVAVGNTYFAYNAPDR